MKCEERCLLCKHSKVGDPCNTKLGLCFEKASKRDLTDRLTVYKIKVEYVNEQIDKAKTKNNTEKKDSKELKAFRKSLREAIKTKDFLQKEVEKCDTVNTTHLFTIDTVKITG